MRRKRELNTQQIDLQIIEERQTDKKVFVEPEVSGPVDVLEATAFFVQGSFGTDPPVGFD
jgi:hypothetical protein